jgi:P27 family predicted phage terminase small subunit
MGRPAKPVERKRKAGNPGKRRLPAPARAELVAAGVPPTPRDLGPAGTQAWTRIWTAGADWLSPSTDFDFLVLIAEAYDTRALIKQALESEPVFGTTDKGFIHVHPGYAALRNTDAQIARWLGLCGFTPSDRTRLGLAEVKRQTNLAALLAKRATHKRGAAARA